MGSGTASTWRPCSTCSASHLRPAGVGGSAVQDAFHQREFGVPSPRRARLTTLPTTNISGWSLICSAAGNPRSGRCPKAAIGRSWEVDPASQPVTQWPASRASRQAAHEGSANAKNVDVHTPYSHRAGACRFIRNTTYGPVKSSCQLPKCSILSMNFDTQGGSAPKAQSAHGIDQGRNRRHGCAHGGGRGLDAGATKRAVPSSNWGFRTRYPDNDALERAVEEHIALFAPTRNPGTACVARSRAGMDAAVAGLPSLSVGPGLARLSHPAHGYLPATVL